ncbi:hypothetical protein E1171_04180 [Cytophagales bacterium RKSG123]|nr:hypothetical protein [Xanthovirga aplysinae]
MNLREWLVLMIASVISLNAIAQQGKDDFTRIVNTSSDEGFPVLSPDGNTFYFSRGKRALNLSGNNNDGNIWMTTLGPSGMWTPPQEMEKPFNDKFQNSVIGFTPDGSIMYQSFNTHVGRNQKDPGVYISKAEGLKGSKPEKVIIRSFLNRSDIQNMRLSEDGNILMMAINSYGSYGTEDIYVSFKQGDGSWSTPRNLGNQVNSRFQELTPYLASDNKTLFFSSNAGGNRGIYRSVRQDDSWINWSEPELLGGNLNTKGMETSYFLGPQDSTAYYISTRNSDGMGRVYKIRISDENQFPQPEIKKEVPEPTFESAVEPPTEKPSKEDEKMPPEEQDEKESPEEKENKEDEKPMEEPSPVKEDQTKIDRGEEGFERRDLTLYPTIHLVGKVVNFQNSQTVSAAVVKFTDLNNDSKTWESIAVDGNFEIELPVDVNFIVTVSANNYMTTRDFLSFENTKSGASIYQTFNLSPLKVGSTFQLGNVQFQKSKAFLLGNSYYQLDQLVQLLKDNPEISIEVGGHTDNQGDPKANLRLSKERVDVVKNYLVKKGIKSNRIEGKGYGATKPIDSNLNEKGRKNNRRVEITVIKK